MHFLLHDISMFSLYFAIKVHTKKPRWRTIKKRAHSSSVAENSRELDENFQVALFQKRNKQEKKEEQHSDERKERKFIPTISTYFRGPGVIPFLDCLGDCEPNLV